MTKIVDCLDLEEVFQFEKNGSTFNFHNYYEEPNRLELEVLRKQVKKKVSIVWEKQQIDFDLTELWFDCIVICHYFMPNVWIDFLTH